MSPSPAHHRDRPTIAIDRNIDPVLRVAIKQPECRRAGGFGDEHGMLLVLIIERQQHIRIASISRDVPAPLNAFGIKIGECLTQCLRGFRRVICSACRRLQREQAALQA